MCSGLHNEMVAELGFEPSLTSQPLSYPEAVKMLPYPTIYFPVALQEPPASSLTLGSKDAKLS